MNIDWAVVMTAVLLQLAAAVVTIEIVAGWNVISAVVVGVSGVAYVMYALRGRDMVVLQIAGSRPAAVIALRPAEVGHCGGVHPDDFEPPSAKAA